MPEYVLILRDDPSQFASLSPAQMQAVIERYQAWGQEIGDRNTGGNKLGDADTAAVISRNGDALVVTDGPFGETKEMIGGYFTIRADNLAHAVELCRNHPQLDDHGTVEIREIDTLMPDA